MNLSNEQQRAVEILREAFPLAALTGPLNPGSDAPLDHAHIITDAWLGRFPPVVSDVAANLNDAVEARVFSISALVATSAALPNVEFYYRNRKYGTPLFLNVVGPAASGKGSVSFGLKVVGRAAETFAERPAVKTADGETRNARLVLPADMSAAGLLGQLVANGGRALVESSELDNLAGTRSNQWGQIDPLLRQAFEHEQVGSVRKGGTVTVPEPHVAAVLSGTFGQFVTMFETAENGLMSRFAFHVLTDERVWDSGGTVDEGHALHAALRASASTLGTLSERLSARATPVTVYRGGPSGRCSTPSSNASSGGRSSLRRETPSSPPCSVGQ